jgi:Ca-activated chloride channel family protein
MKNRSLNREDFNNDNVDAGEIGAGHSVTAIYEIALVGSGGQKVDPLRYQDDTVVSASSSELAYLKLRYKDPVANTSKLLEWQINRSEMIDSIDDATTDFRFAAAVAAFSQLLRGGEQTGEFDYEDVQDLARDARGDDPFGYRSEFLSLVRLTESLNGPSRQIQQVGLVAE